MLPKTALGKRRKAQNEQMLSGLPPKAAVERTSMDFSQVPIGDISHSVVLGLDLLLLLGDGLRLFGYRKRDNFLLRFLFFREAQVGLRYVDEDRTNT
jgi:hypothetical protein